GIVPPFGCGDHHVGQHDGLLLDRRRPLLLRRHTVLYAFLVFSRSLVFGPAPFAPRLVLSLRRDGSLRRAGASAGSSPAGPPFGDVASADASLIAAGTAPST